MEKVKIKILGISCAHRKGRNTSWLTLYTLKAIEKFGRRVSKIADVETELIDLSLHAKEIKPCTDCDRRCEISSSGMHQDIDCIIQDDYLAKELIPKMAEADGYIFGSPVFTGAYTSNFRVLFERLRSAKRRGYFANKPVGGVTTAYMRVAGQESCLEFMTMCMQQIGMLPVHWMHGAVSVSGPPYGPIPADDDGTIIGVKNDRYGQWMAALVGRRVGEIALMRKLALRRLGNLYKQEFIQIYHPHYGDASWEWAELDVEDEDYMLGLNTEELQALDGLKTQPEMVKRGKDKCKFLGLSCSNRRGRNTAWLVLYSLKAIEKFGRRIANTADFETEFIDIADKDIKPCLNCNRRYEIPNRGRPWKGSEVPQDFGCIIKNDYLAQEILPRIGEADGFVFGSPVATSNPSAKFRLLSQRYMVNLASGHISNKPTTNIAVGYYPNSGQDTCLHMMNMCNRFVEFIPVSWPLGVSATSGPAFGSIPLSDDGKMIGVKNDKMARFLAIYNGRRVAEWALILKLAKEELGNLYLQEFMRTLHPPHGEGPWEWYRLDKDDEDYLMSLTPAKLIENST
jgi:multimeric flavodoxin WrbA